MASQHIIDLTALLAPISAENPTGSDIRTDSSPNSKYQQIKIARSAARAAERKSIHEGDTTEADEHWRKILNLAPDILLSQSKDLEIVSWLTEALIRKHGFQGLRDSFELIHGLVESFWDNLYPMPDEDGMETRTSPLSGLNGEGAEGVLIAPIRKVPITQGDAPGPFSFWQYQQASDAQRAASDSIRESKIEKLGFSLETIDRAVDVSSSEFFVDQIDDLTQCIDFCKKLNTLLDQHCGVNDAPSMRNILEVLEECRGVVMHIAKHKLPTPAEEPEVDASTAADDNNSSGSAPASAKVVKGAVNSREEALKQLLEISTFFRKTEPHSPLSYLLEKTVRWGNMSLNDLIVELIPDSDSRKHFSQLTGVINPEDAS